MGHPYRNRLRWRGSIIVPMILGAFSRQSQHQPRRHTAVRLQSRSSSICARRILLNPPIFGTPPRDPSIPAPIPSILSVFGIVTPHRPLVQIHAASRDDQTSPVQFNWPPTRKRVSDLLCFRFDGITSSLPVEWGSFTENDLRDGISDSFGSPMYPRPNPLSMSSFHFRFVISHSSFQPALP
jgi:hypothetical protein